jgi:alanyl-tRNA synthetase
MAVELLTLFGLDLSRLWVTTFGGDPTINLLPDEFTRGEWQRHGFPTEYIVPLDMEDNFWDMGAGVPGPCGPCTELFLDCGPEHGCRQPECRPGCSCERFLEIWNLVFIEFERSPEGTLTRLPFLSVDTGMGLERIGMVLQGVPSLFNIDLFQPAIEVLNSLAPVRKNSDMRLDQRARRIVLDHTRAALFACLEGVLPGQENRNSVVRRLHSDRGFPSDLATEILAERGLTIERKENWTRMARESQDFHEVAALAGRDAPQALDWFERISPIIGDVISLSCSSIARSDVSHDESQVRKREAKKGDNQWNSSSIR